MPVKLDVPDLIEGGSKAKKTMKVRDMKNVKPQKPMKPKTKPYKSPKTGSKKVTIVLPEELTDERVPQAQPLPESKNKQTLDKEVKQKEAKLTPIQETVQNVSKKAFNDGVNYLLKNEHITPEQASEAKEFQKEFPSKASIALDAITDALPFVAGVLSFIPQSSAFGQALLKASPLVKQGRKMFKDYTGLGISDKKQLVKNIKQLQQQGIDNDKISEELNNLVGGALNADELTKLLTEGTIEEVEKEFGKAPERGYKSGNKLKWMEALQIWNETRDIYCIPKKGTKEYDEVRQIMVNGV
jgi:hypothetical protein